jgi:uncharacterized membrane protein YhaH (DUF805 family)
MIRGLCRRPAWKIRMSWFLYVLRHYATFRGRARRREYWTFLAVYVPLYAALLLLDLVTGSFDMESQMGTLTGLYVLATIVPGTAVAVRRLHDTGRSGWWLLIGLVPLLGAIVLLYFLVQEGAAGDNPYGADPKGGVGVAAPGQGV